MSKIKKPKSPKNLDGKLKEALKIREKEIKKIAKLQAKENDKKMHDQKLEEERLALAEKFGINLVRPKQTKRIQALFDLYQKYLFRSSNRGYMQIIIAEMATELGKIYQKQQNEIYKLENLDEPKEFIKTRVAYILNKDRPKILELEEKIDYFKKLLVSYKNRQTHLTELSDEEKKRFQEIQEEVWKNHMRSFEINKELRNTIIGYENRLCLYKVGKLYLDYKVLVNQELDKYRERLTKQDLENRYEYNQILRHFNLPPEKLADFQIFLKKKIESKFKDSQELKNSFGKFYDFDIDQINSLVREIEEQKAKDFKNLVQVVNHYKEFLLKKQYKSEKAADELIYYIQKRYNSKIDELNQMIKEYSEDYKFTRNLPEGEVKSLLLDLNQQEFNYRLEKLKQKYSNIIKPLTDDYDNMVYLVKRDNAFDIRKQKEKLFELKTLENLGVQKYSDFFEKEKAALEKLFQKKYDFINSPNQYAFDELGLVVKKLQDDCALICENILSYNTKYWVNTHIEFNFEVKRFLARFHSENAPWTQKWRKHSMAWMHEYLILNLSSEYLRHVGESLKSFSPEATLYINIAKALFKFNEESRKLYKNRDQVELEQLVRLNTVPSTPLQEIKEISTKSLVFLKEQNESLKRVIKNLENNLKKK